MVEPMPAAPIEPQRPAPSIGAAISWAFDAFKRNLTPFIALAAVVTIVQLVQTIATNPMVAMFETCADAETEGQLNACTAAAGVGVVVGGIVAFLFYLIAVFAMIGVTRAALRTTQGGTPSFADMLTTQNLGRYILVSLAYVGIVFVGLILCVIPGLILAFLLQLAPYYVLDKGYRVGEALKASLNAVKRNVGPALVMVVFTFLVSIIGTTLWGIPTLVTLPFATLFIAHMYRQFNNEPVTG